jgi:nucleotide-binding universal stress UspA family protein
MQILVAVDGSAPGKAALRFVAARLGGLRPRPQVELINVQLPIPAHAARFLGGRTVRDYHAAESRKVLAPAQAMLEKAGLSTRTTAAVGSPGALIAGAARRADLVVMGAHGRTATAGLLFGSVTTTVLATCATPLLIMRGASRPAPALGTALRVGIAIDGSAYGLAAVRYVLKHRDLFGRVPDLQLIHVVPDLFSAYVPGLALAPTPMFSPEQAIEGQRAAFESAVAPVRRIIKRAGLTAAEVRLIGNSPGDEIAAHARKNRLDMLVLGSHGHGAFTSVVLGSVATRVAARCETPLLVIRSK